MDPQGVTFISIQFVDWSQTGASVEPTEYKRVHTFVLKQKDLYRIKGYTKTSKHKKTT